MREAIYLSLLAFLFIVFVVFQAEKAETNDLKPLFADVGNYENCAKFTKLEIVDKCYASFGHKEKREDICKKIKTEFWKDYCYFDLALHAKSLDFCELIAANGSKSLCLKSVG